MSSEKLKKDINRGVQRTFSNFLDRSPKKKNIMEIELNPNVKVFSNSYTTASGLVTEKIIKIIQHREKGFIGLSAY